MNTSVSLTKFQNSVRNNGFSLAALSRRPWLACMSVCMLCPLSLCVCPSRPGQAVQYLRTSLSAKNGIDSCDKQFLSDCLCP